MKRQTGLLLGSALLLVAHSSWATVCQNSNGTPTDVFYDLSNVFNSSNNQPGQVVTLPEKSGWLALMPPVPPGRRWITPIEAMSLNFRFKVLRVVFST